MSELVIGVIVFVALTMAVVEGIALAILTALRVCDWLAERVQKPTSGDQNGWTP